MAHFRTVTFLFVLCLIIGSACSPAPVTAAPQPTTTDSPPTPTPAPTKVLPPEKNVASGKPVRVSAAWVVDPAGRAVDGNLDNWWGAGGEPPQWIEVDLGGLYDISRIRVLNQGPSGKAEYRVFGRGLDNRNQLLHVFDGTKFAGQTLEISPDQPWEGIATVRVEINNGSGWVGLREILVFSREDPQPLPATPEPAPLFQSQIRADDLEELTPDNVIRMQPLAGLGLGMTNELSWSPRGDLFAAAGALGVWLYDPASLQAEPRLLSSHSRAVLTVAFSADGGTLFSGSQDGTVKLWDSETGVLKRTRRLFDDFSYEVGSQERNAEVWTMAFNHDQSLVATGAFDGTIKIFNLTTGNPIGEINEHSGMINALAFSDDGRYLASCAADGKLFIWDVDTFKKYAELSGYPGAIWHLAFSPDSLTLATAGGDGKVRLWEIAAKHEKAILADHTAGVVKLAFVGDGDSLISSSSDTTIRLWDLQTGVSTILVTPIPFATGLAVDPSGGRLVLKDYYIGFQIWDIKQGRLMDEASYHTNSVTSIDFNTRNEWLAAGYEDGSIRFWDVEPNIVVRTLWAHQAGVTGVAFNPEGSRLASSSFDGTVILWDVNSGRALNVLEGHRSYVRCVAFSPDGNLIASGSTDSTVRLWDAQSGEEVAVLQGHTNEVSKVRFSTDGSRLVSVSSDFTVRIWDVASATQLDVFRNHTSFVQSGSFSPDGGKIATVSGDHTLRLIDSESGREVFSPKGHGGWVLDVTFSPQGDMIASTNVSTTSFWVAPGEIHLYSADTGYPYVMLLGHTRRVTCLAFLFDGKVLASGSADGSILIWGVPASTS